MKVKYRQGQSISEIWRSKVVLFLNTVDAILWTEYYAFEITQINLKPVCSAALIFHSKNFITTHRSNSSSRTNYLFICFAPIGNRTNPDRHPTPLQFGPFSGVCPQANGLDWCGDQLRSHVVIIAWILWGVGKSKTPCARSDISVTEKVNAVNFYFELIF